MNRKDRQRIQRAEKRQLYNDLVLQSRENKGEVTISRYIDLDRSFESFAVNNKELHYNEAEHRFENRLVSRERQILINEAIRLQNKIGSI